MPDGCQFVAIQAFFLCVHTNILLLLYIIIMYYIYKYTGLSNDFYFLFAIKKLQLIKILITINRD